MKSIEGTTPYSRQKYGSIRRGKCTSVEQLEEGVILWKVKMYNSVQKRKIWLFGTWKGTTRLSRVGMALWNMERYNSAEQIKVLVLWNVERYTSVNRKGFGSVEL